MLHFQPYETKDIDQVVDIATRAAESAGVDPYSTLESVPNKDTLSLTMNTAVRAYLVMNSDNEPVGFATIRYWKEDDDTEVYLHAQLLAPVCQDPASAREILNHLQSDILKLYEKGSKAVFATNASESEHDLNEMLVEDGYAVVWSQVEMEITDFSHLPESLEPPEGFEDIEVGSDDEQIKKEVYQANKSVYRGEFGSSPENEDDYEEFLEDNPDFSLWRVCRFTEKGEVVGFVLSKIDGERAEIMEVTVVDKPEYRRKGLATYLMLKTIADLHSRNINRIRLHTDAEGKKGGRQLYEKLGFKALKTHYRYRKPIVMQ